MLVIRRKEGQAIRIGGGIRIEVLESSPNRVKLGIVAPPEVRVVREEVLLAEAQNRESAAAAPPDVLASWAHQLRLPRPWRGSVPGGCMAKGGCIGRRTSFPALPRHGGLNRQPVWPSSRFGRPDGGCAQSHGTGKIPGRALPFPAFLPVCDPVE